MIAAERELMSQFDLETDAASAQINYKKPEAVQKALRIA
jgi:hypothetical protein